MAFVGRRGLLAGGAAAALVGGAAWRARRETAPAFEPHPTVPGFRRLVAAGDLSSGGAGRYDGLIGIAAAPDPVLGPAREAVARDPCAALFGMATPGATGGAGEVPVASFSDYNCPYCRVATERLAALAATPESPVRVAWHELPLLGEGSAAAARAALAAARQGAYPQIHARLMRSRFQVTPAYVEALAAEMGLDADRLLADMASPEIEAELARSAALADLFGLAGTPAMVVGRTVVVGAIGERTLARLVARERVDGPVPACAG